MSSIAQDVQKQIEEAYHRGKEIARKVADRERAERSELVARRREAWRELDYALGLPDWAVEYLAPEFPEGWPSDHFSRRLMLPGCAPISIRFLMNGSTILRTNGIYAWEPVQTVREDLSGEWYVKTEPTEADDGEIDHAIYMANCWGESYAAMQAEADRLNALQPEIPTYDETLDHNTWAGIDATGKALSLAEDHADEPDRAQVWATIAVARELRTIADLLGELTTHFVETDPVVEDL